MCDFNMLYNKVKENKTFNILGKEYSIKNCILATDGEILKVSATLISDNSEITLFTELRNLIDINNKN